MSRQSHLGFIRAVGWAAMVAIVGMGMSISAGAAVPLSQVAEKYIACAKPVLREHEPYRGQGRTGFGVAIQGEPYYFILADRILVAFDAVERGGTVANLKLDLPTESEFDEQAVWRERMLADVADRSGVPLERSSPRAGMTLLTVNKRSLMGKSAGISMLIDRDREVMVEWAWSILDRYQGPDDVKALQAEVWKHLLPCLKPA